MKNLVFLILFCSLGMILQGQTPRIALVKPNGITTIHTTLQAAYNAASNDDYIYLPGGQFSLGVIDKKIHIIGAGSNIDSSAITGITRLNLTLSEGCQGGSIEGLYMEGLYFSYTSLPTSPLSGFEIKRCYLIGGITVSTSISWENMIITNCYIGSSSPCSGCNSISINGNLSNSIIKNCIITQRMSMQSYNIFSNNIFFYNGSGYPSQMQLPAESTYNNNIFLLNPQGFSSTFNNNVNCEYPGITNTVNNNINETFPEIFENPGTAPYTYIVHNDYHIKSSSACKNSGTDGTDRGIYGGSKPWVEGSIPSNPHIYFKNVAEETNTNGQLQIHFKVRTN